MSAGARDDAAAGGPAARGGISSGVDASLTRLLVTDDRLARATWSRLAEPADGTAIELVARHGAGPALEVVLTQARAGPREVQGPPARARPATGAGPGSPDGWPSGLPGGR